MMNNSLDKILSIPGFLILPVVMFIVLSVLLAVLVEDGRIWGNGSSGNSIESLILLTVVVCYLIFLRTSSPFQNKMPE